MKYVKWFFIGVIGILLLANIVGMFFPRIAEVSVSKIVDGTPSFVFEQIVAPRKYQTWQPWAELDSTMQAEYFGPESGKGAGYTWKGNDKVGVGRWELVRVRTAPYSADVLLSMDGMGTSDVSFLVVPAQNQSEVTWSIAKDFGWIPMFRLFTPMFKNYILHDFTRGLDRLANWVATLPHGRVDTVEIVRMESFPILSIREHIYNRHVGEALARMYGTIMPYIFQNNLSLAQGPPIAIYHGSNAAAETYDLEAAIAMKAITAPGLGMKARMVDGGAFIKVTYLGPYEQLDIAKQAADTYAHDHGLKVGTEVMEFYVTDPQSQKDPNKWRTDVYKRQL